MGTNGPGRAVQRCPRGEISLLQPAVDIIEQPDALRRATATGRPPARHRARPPRCRARRARLARRAKAIAVTAAVAGLTVAIAPAVYFAAAHSPLAGSAAPCDVCRLAIPSSGPVPKVPGVSPDPPVQAHKNAPTEMAKVSRLAAAPAPSSGMPAPSSGMPASSPRMPAPAPASYFSWFMPAWWGYGGLGGDGHRAGRSGGGFHGR